MGEKEYNYSYEDGRLIRATESDITLSGEIVTAKTVIHTIRYYYDSDGQMTRKYILPAEGTAQVIYYETSEDNTAVKFYAGGQYVTSHSKSDEFGRKVFDELQLGTGFVSRQFSYHTGEATEEHIENRKLKSSPTTQLVSSIALSDGRTLSYEYDEEERITKVTETFQGENVTVTEYTYDALGQLLTETVNGEVVNTMTYDNYGNIVSKNGVAYTYGDEHWKDLLTKYGDKNITYDAQGNPVNYLAHTLTWEKGRQLKKFVKTDGTVIDYTYNANGIRTSKIVNGVKHTYTLDGTKILRETWIKDGVNYSIIPMYDNEDSVCGIQYNGEPFYFQKNLQGDIIAIVDKDAVAVARYAYDAWGVCTTTEDVSGCGIAEVNPYRYRGYYFDSEIEMYYLQSRYYNPIINRFICADVDEVVAASQRILNGNHYCYCENDSINNKDENGGISFKQVLSIFNTVAKYAKIIMDWVKTFVEYKLILYTSLSPEDISAIAKDIKRSPHRVRQFLQDLCEKWSKIKSRIGKMAIAITIIGLIVSVSSSLANNVSVIDIVATHIVEGLVELTKWLVSEGVKKLISLVPAIGALLSFSLATLISVALDGILSTKFVKSIKNKFQKIVKTQTYKTWDYLTAYFKSWA